MMTEDLLNLLRRSTRKIIGEQTRVAVAYSGGVDSSVVAALAREIADVECYTCVVKSSFDALNAPRRAREERIDLRIIDLGPERLTEEIHNAAEILDTPNPVEIAYTIPLLVVLRESSERIVLSGNGADELFAGYSKYVSSQNPEAAMASDRDKMLNESSRIQKWSSEIGKRLGLPFVDDDVVSLSIATPLDHKISSSERKIILREVARQLGLPSSDRPKKAAQYSSGILRLMERIAKKDGLSTAEWTEGIARAGRRSA
jgi:asparagine synthase (glutamine-hydrolysing)